MGLTRTQAKALEFIRSFIAANGYPPSLGEISEGMGCSANSRARAGEVVRALEDRGYLRRMPNRARAIELIEQGTPERNAVRLSPEVERAVARHSKGASLEVATNEMLREYLGIAA